MPQYNQNALKKHPLWGMSSLSFQYWDNHRYLLQVRLTLQQVCGPLLPCHRIPASEAWTSAVLTQGSSRGVPDLTNVCIAICGFIWLLGLILLRSRIEINTFQTDTNTHFNKRKYTTMILLIIWCSLHETWGSDGWVLWICSDRPARVIPQKYNSVLSKHLTFDLKSGVTAIRSCSRGALLWVQAAL